MLIVYYIDKSLYQLARTLSSPFLFIYFICFTHLMSPLVCNDYSFIWYMYSFEMLVRKKNILYGKWRVYSLVFSSFYPWRN